MSWEQLLNLVKQAQEEAFEEMYRPPVACPNDGEPLIEGPNGELHCRFDGYIWRSGSSSTQ